MVKAKRNKTGIIGFDELVEGGFPVGATVLLSGTAGTGKTIFSIEYLYNGATEFKEKGIYFTFEEKKESLFEQASQFGWDLEKLEKERKLKIISLGISNISKTTFDDILEIISSFGANRVVIDSLTTLSYLAPEQHTGSILCENYIKKFIYSFITRFQNLKNVTTIFVSQRDIKLVDDLSKYTCDGVIEIDYESLGTDYSRNMTIKKMRKTKHDEDLHPLEIGEKGLNVHKLGA
jgi:circadian clock protein KaiC